MEQTVSLYYKCDWCGDRGVDAWYDPDLKKNFSVPCKHCDPRRDKNEADRQHGKEYEDAVKWFRKTQAPVNPFNLYPWKPIDDPSALWQRIATDLQSDNFYTREWLVDVLIALFKVFNSTDEDF